jgi:hypothetical protein
MASTPCVGSQAAINQWSVRTLTHADSLTLLSAVALDELSLSLELLPGGQQHTGSIPSCQQKHCINVVGVD